MTTTTTTPATVTEINRYATNKERKHSLRITYTNNYRVVVSTTHDKQRKCYRTTLSLVTVENLDNGFVIEKSIGSIFDKLFVNTISTIVCNRYSDTSFANAVEFAISLYFNSYESEYVNQIAQLIETGSDEN